MRVGLLRLTFDGDEARDRNTVEQLHSQEGKCVWCGVMSFNKCCDVKECFPTTESVKLIDQ